MLAREPQNPALHKYASVAALLCQRSFDSHEEAWEQLVALLDDWTRRLALPTLDEFGVTAGDFEHVVAHSRGSSMKTNPIVLSDAEITEVLAQRCAR